MRTMTRFIAFAALTLSSGAGSRCPGGAPADDGPAAARNLLPNASFEDADGARPRGWRPERWNGRGASSHADTGRTGGRSVQISSTEGADWGWVATVPVEPFARYRLSGTSMNSRRA